MGTERGQWGEENEEKDTEGEKIPTLRNDLTYYPKTMSHWGDSRYFNGQKIWASTLLLYELRQNTSLFWPIVYSS